MNEYPVIPRVAHPKKGRTRAEYNAYMKAYMKDYRARHHGRDMRLKSNGGGHKPRHDNPIFDPKRDGNLPEHHELTAVLMGDPPVGRRAIDVR